MKIRRYKRVQRFLSFYKHNFAIRGPPFRILADGTFCKAALDMKINLAEQLRAYLGGHVEVLTTSCIRRELELLGPPFYGALQVAKGCAKERCRHMRMGKDGRPKGQDPCTAAQCIEKLVGPENKEKYFVGSLDPKLTETLKAVPGVPILYIRSHTLLLDQPTELSGAVADRTIAKKLESQISQVSKLKRAGQILEDEAPPVKKRRKIKGPNPLSCKKKKTVKLATNSVSETAQNGRKRRRRHKLKERNVASNEA